MKEWRNFRIVVTIMHLLSTSPHTPKASAAGASNGRSGARGFTIVELLIVIVVIAILAAISVVAYVGVQERAEDARMISTARQIQTALQLHFEGEGRYPSPCFNESGERVQNPEWTLGCNALYVAPHLVPQYIASMPATDGMFYAVGGYATQRKAGYGLRLECQARERCKILGGQNPKETWWSADEEC